MSHTGYISVTHGIHKWSAFWPRFNANAVRLVEDGGTWAAAVEYVLRAERAERAMVGWVCGVTLRGKKPS
jgi:hypothetical protein